MSEQQVDTPEQVRKFAPRRQARSSKHPTDQAGEALVNMLHEAAKVSGANQDRVMDLVHDLRQQLQAAEDRVGQLQREIDHFRARASGAEQWLERIQQEIEQSLIGPLTRKQS